MVRRVPESARRMRFSWLRPDRPFDVRNRGGYYGWVILAVGTLGMSAAVPGSPPGMSVFVDAMLEALALGRDQFAMAYMIGTVAAGLSAPFAGRLIDRYGSRFIAGIAFVALGLVLVYMGLVDRLHAFLAGGRQLPWLAFVLVTFAFGGMRLAGVGFALTACRSMVFRWFEGRRGWAAGVNGVLLAIAFSSAPTLFNGLSDSLGWRGTWIALGLFFVFGMTLLAYVFFRDSPEACGVAVETGGADKHEELKTRVPVARDFTGREAVRTGVFWIIAAGLALNALIGTGISFHIVALGAEHGIPPDRAVLLFPPIALFHISTTLALGAIADKIRIKFALMLMVVGQSLALIGAARLDDPFFRWMYIGGSGVGWGAFGILLNLPWPRFFGRRYLGSINGWVTSVTLVMSAMGPYVFGLAAAASGSFDPALIACFTLCPFMLVLAAFADNPQRKFANDANAGDQAREGGMA